MIKVQFPKVLQMTSLLRYNGLYLWLRHCMIVVPCNKVPGATVEGYCVCACVCVRASAPEVETEAPPLATVTN